MENCRPSSRLLRVERQSPPTHRERERERMEERALRKLSFRERLSRQVSRSTLRAAARFSCSTKTHLRRAGPLRRAQRLFPPLHVYKCARARARTYIRIYGSRGQFMHDKSEARNRTRYRSGFSSAAEKIWASIKASYEEAREKEREKVHDSGV